MVHIVSKIALLLALAMPIRISSTHTLANQRRAANWPPRVTILGSRYFMRVKVRGAVYNESSGCSTMVLSVSIIRAKASLVMASVVYSLVGPTAKRMSRVWPKSLFRQLPYSSSQELISPPSTTIRSLEPSHL